MYRRFEKLRTTLSWLGPLTAGPFATMLVLLRRRQNPNAVLTVKYRGAPLYFRGVDSDAIEEVLHNGEYAFLNSYLRSLANPVILDVGAHIGTFAIWALAIRPSASILSVEADPETFAVVEKNILSRSARWQAINRAANSRDEGVMRFSTFGPSMSHRISETGNLEVKTVSLSTLIGKVDPDGLGIDLLKVDIEGSEEKFLCNSGHLLSRVRRLVIELHPRACNTDRVREVIAQHFDDVSEVAGRRSGKPLLHCTR